MVKTKKRKIKAKEKVAVKPIKENTDRFGLVASSYTTFSFNLYDVRNLLIPLFWSVGSI